MLDAFLIAGLVTAIATPVLLLAIELLKLVKVAAAGKLPKQGKSNDENAPLIIDEAGQVSVDGAASDAATAVPEPMIDKPEPGVVHDVPADVSELIIPVFRPGLDSCRVWLRSADVETRHRTCTAGVVLTFRDAAERLTITFQGLASPPFADIETIVDRPGRGRQVQRLTDPGNADPVQATPEDLDDANWQLAAWAETERAVEAFDEPVQPTNTGQDDLTLPEFAGFDPAAEFIEVWVPSALDADINVEVVPTKDGLHGLVLVEGQPAALLQGAPTASARNVRVVPTTAKAA